MNTSGVWKLTRKAKVAKVIIRGIRGKITSVLTLVAVIAICLFASECTLVGHCLEKPPKVAPWIDWLRFY